MATQLGLRQRCDWTSVASLAYAHVLAAYALEGKPDKVGGRAFFITDDDQNQNNSALGIFTPAAKAMGILVRPVIPVPGWLIPPCGYMMEKLLLWFDRLVGFKADPLLTFKEGLKTVITQTHDISAAKTLLGYRPIMTTQQCQDWTAEEMVRRYQVFM